MNLLDQVFLMTTAVGAFGAEHNLFRVRDPFIGDVEQIANLIEQTELAFFA